MTSELIEEIDWDESIVAVHPMNHLKERMFPHKVSLIIPRDENGKFILSRRALDKHPWPDTWVCAVGGKVNAGESYEEAALREMEKEIGVSCEVEDVCSFKYNGDIYKAVFRVFTTKKPVKIESFKPDPKEIQYFRSFTKEELEKEINQNPEQFAGTFVSSAKAFINNIE